MNVVITIIIIIIISSSSSRGDIYVVVVVIIIMILLLFGIVAGIGWRLTGVVCCSAGISIGSEMSGGVSNVTVEKVLVWDSRRGVRIKTAPGRGGYVRNITYRGIVFHNLRVGIVVKTDYNEHPPDGAFDPRAVPAVEGITFSGVHGRGVRVPVRLQGSAEIPVRGLTFRDLAVGLAYKKKHVFQCAFVQGRVLGAVFPAPCANLDLYDERGNLVRPSSTPNITDVDYDI